MKRIIIIFVTLLLVCFASCVQETHLKTITFKVDMNAVSTVENVGIKGNFTNPPWEKMIPMTDVNNDGTYEVTIEEKTAQNGIQFKFVNQHNQFELENQPNRRLQLEYKPQTITYEAVFDVSDAKNISNH